MYYTEQLYRIREACHLGRGEFAELGGRATCALHAGETPPDLTALVKWLDEYPEIYVDDMLVPKHTRDIALFGKTLANHLMLMRLEQRYAKRKSS